MNNPFSTLTKKEWLLWLCSLFIVLVSNILAANFDPLTLIAALVGVTSLVFAPKGNVWAQVLMIVFSILYGIISFRFRYWGEMITYLGMALPMAVWSAITWLRHPAESGDAVAIQKLNLRLPGCWPAALWSWCCFTAFWPHWTHQILLSAPSLSSLASLRRH